MTNIFVSYSRVDEEKAKHIVTLLEYGYGDRVWRDTAPQGIIGGEDWWSRILTQIKQCDYFLYLLSPESIDSEYCVRELEKALELEKYVIPIRVRARTEIPDKISHLQVIDAFHQDTLTEGIARIYGAIARHTPTAHNFEFKNLTDAHRQADLRLLKKFWSYLPSQYILRQLNHEVYNGKIGERSYDYYLLYGYLDIKDSFEYKYFNPSVESKFQEFHEKLEAFAQAKGSYSSPDDRGFYVFDYIAIKHPKDFVAAQARKDQELLEMKKEQWQDTIELYEKVTNEYEGLIDLIRFQYPEFDFSRE